MTTTKAWPARAESRERNRQALLNAAGDLAKEQGYSGTSLAAVAERAGLSTGAVYSIFGSKVELFLEVLLPEWHVLQSEDLPTDEGDLTSFLDAYARQWVGRLRAGDARQAFELELELYLAALREPRLLSKTRKIFEASEQRLATHLKGLAGPPLRVPSREVARSLVAVMQGLSQISVALGEDPDEELFVRAALRVGADASTDLSSKAVPH